MLFSPPPHNPTYWRVMGRRGGEDASNAGADTISDNVSEAGSDDSDKTITQESFNNLIKLINKFFGKSND